MKKESLSIMTVKTLLAVVIFGMGMIIIGGGYLIRERGKMLNDKIIKPETEIRAIDNEKYCEKDKDCKLIYSSCSCEAVNTSSKKTYFKTGNEPEPLCVVNLCVMNDITATCINNECTADWKTYRNEEYGFEVKYPNDWERIDKTPAIMSFVYKGNEKNIIQIRSDDRKNDISFMEQIKGRGDIEPELVKINNKDFYFLKASMAGLMFYEYYIENKNKIFIISMINISDFSKDAKNESDIKYPTDEELYEELNILKAMASTFKFIEK